MWVSVCFEGDGDMARAWVQHDLYFVSETRPEVSIDRHSTLSWIWKYVQHQAERRRHSIPWINRNMERIDKIDRFSHKLLQQPHAHIAAYHRWTMPRVARDPVNDEADDALTMALLDDWRAFLRTEIPDLLSSNDALVALAKSIVYRHFDAGDEAYYKLQDILMRRYGFECVSRTWWAPDVRDRIQATPGNTMTTTNQRGANA